MGPSSIIGVQAIRVTRLGADGTPAYAQAQGAFMMCGGVSTFEHSFEIEEGADIFQEDANGAACVVRKKPDRVKRLTFTLTMCRSDYRLDEIFGLSNNVISPPNVVGRAIKSLTGCGTQAFPNGVSLELWSEQWDCDAPLAGAPYMRTVIPRAYLTPQGFTRENGVSLPVYGGFGVVNNNFSDGPFGDLDVLTSQTNWLMADVDDPALPVCPSPIGYVGTPPSSS